MTETPRRHGRLRRTGAAVALVTVSLLVGLMLCEVAARVIWPHWTEFYAWRFERVAFVPGWGGMTLGKPGFKGWFAQNDGDFRVPITLDSLGMRNDEPPSAAGGKLWVIGDSFAFGWGVRRNETFGAVAGRVAGLAVHSLAHPGANLCGYEASVTRMPAGVEPRAVVVGITMENDISRYHCLHGKGPATPPPGWTPERSKTFHFADVKLFLMEHSALYNGIAVALKRVDAVDRLLEATGLVATPHADHEVGMGTPPEREARAESTADEIAYLKSEFPAGTPFVALIIPSRFDIRDGAPADIQLRHDLVAALRRKGIALVDPRDALKAAGFWKVHFHHDGHWSPAGHAIAGRELGQALKRILAGSAGSESHAAGGDTRPR